MLNIQVIDIQIEYFINKKKKLLNFYEKKQTCIKHIVKIYVLYYFIDVWKVNEELYIIFTRFSVRKKWLRLILGNQKKNVDILLKWNKTYYIILKSIYFFHTQKIK